MAPSSPAAYFRVGPEKVYYSQDERAAIGAAQERAMTEIARLVRSRSYQRLPDDEGLARQGETTKKDAIQAVLRRHRAPVLDRANRQARARAVQEARG
jgi:hypothetical protein